MQTETLILEISSNIKNMGKASKSLRTETLMMEIGLKMKFVEKAN